MSASDEMGHLVPTLIRDAYPRHASKEMARAADVPLETSRNWLRRRAIPSAATLLKAAARCERFADALARLARDLEARGERSAEAQHGAAESGRAQGVMT